MKLADTVHRKVTFEKIGFLNTCCQKYEILPPSKSGEISQSEARQVAVFRLAPRTQRKLDSLRLIIVKIMTIAMQSVLRIQERVSSPFANDLMDRLVPIKMLF